MLVVRSILIYLVILMVGCSGKQQFLELPRIISDNMVLQRNTEVKLWGWTNAGADVTVTPSWGEERYTKANDKGKWELTVKTPNKKGPFSISFNASGKEIVVKNVITGIIWLASGQSNMEWPLSKTDRYDQDIAGIETDDIRLFRINHEVGDLGNERLGSGEWLICDSVSASSFSSVGYYFGKQLMTELKTPIGLIQSAWGGSKIEAWMKPEWLLGYERVENQLAALDSGMFSTLKAQWRGNENSVQRILKADVGVKEKWYKTGEKSTSWSPVEKLGTFSDIDKSDYDGTIWYQGKFKWSDNDLSQAKLVIGPIDDQDITYLNGQEIGRGRGWNRERRYEIPVDILKKGLNTIVIQVLDTKGEGGFSTSSIHFTNGVDSFEPNISWSYRIGEEIKPKEPALGRARHFASVLYQGMIQPLIAYQIDGVIWYQGESNSGRAYDYRSLFKQMIEGWRKEWNSPDLPFYYVQLANYMKVKEKPSESKWAELREAQAMALELKNTSMTVTIDIGEADDIHPRNKKEVGRRLAIKALKNVYGVIPPETVVNGPSLATYEVKNSQVHLKFDNSEGMHLKALAGRNEFSIAGADSVFVWAKAKVSDDKVIVWHPEVTAPIAVRYAWADNPDKINLYNGIGLPASPFRTDQFGVKDGM